MLNVNISIDNISNLDNVLKKVNKAKINTFNEFVKRKVQKVLEQVIADNLVGGTTNDDSFELYKNSNHFEDIKDKNSSGFILYNDARVSHEGYDSGIFSIALAFEYGTGIIGAGDNISGAWEYNINDNHVYYHGEDIPGWWISKTKVGSSETFGESIKGSAVITRGYHGMEIYRKVADIVNQNINEWAKEYMKEV